jgi:hypothetical protein
MATAESITEGAKTLTSPALPVNTLAELGTSERLAQITYPESCYEPVRIVCDIPGCGSAYQAEVATATAAEARHYAVTLANWRYMWPLGGAFPPPIVCPERHVRPSARHAAGDPPASPPHPGNAPVSATGTSQP